MRYNCYWWITLLSLLDLCCLKTWGVWIPGIKDICICGMRLTIDVAIDDLNWYVVMLIFMMILIWDDVVSDDQVNMNWCYYWWLCWYGMRLLLLMSLLVTLIDMWWYWCLWWYWFELTLLIKTMSTWINGIVDDYMNMKWGCCCVDNVIKTRWCLC